MSIVSRILPNQRTRHAVIAAAIAMVLATFHILEPLDRLSWMVESRIGTNQLSQNFVLVESDKDLADPARPGRRANVARVLSKLEEAGAERVFVDVVFSETSSQQADTQLSEAIASLGDKVVLAQKYEVGLGQAETPESTIETIAGSAQFAADRALADYTGFVWEMPRSVEVDGTSTPTIPTLLANNKGLDRDLFYVDYNFNPAEIPTLSFAKLKAGEISDQLPVSLAGKTVIIGHSAKVPSGAIDIPGNRDVSTSLVQILAAETLLKGGQMDIGVELLLAVYAMMLLAIARFASERSLRVAGYWIISLSPIALLYFCNQTGTPSHLAHPLGLLAIFGLLRFLANRKSQQMLTDSATGLSTFLALERDLAKTGNVRGSTVVVAKLHRFDEVTSALSDEAIAEYVQQIAGRFRIADDDLQVYTKGGKYLAWIAETADREMLDSHLRGLRAVFAHPLLVKHQQIDVGITFAADLTPEDNAARKIASASSTVEKTTEAHEPVLFAEMASEGDRWWNISLQAKIDKALEDGHIYVVFQPKLNVRKGTVDGAEALVRWEDPERGNISPNYFIEQCENAGRMDHLTRHVLREALLAAKDFAQVNSGFSVSVNISATMLRDYRVAEMVEEVIEKTSFNPRNLVLEITETSRIADYEIAYDVMTRLRLHGIKLSVDDFGVGSASMETLLRLPFDELKIDRAFIARIQDDPKARAISQMMIAFGKQTRITVVAEGVEDEESLKLLRDLGCEIVQGYHISKPLDKQKFAYFQKDNKEQTSRHALYG